MTKSQISNSKFQILRLLCVAVAIATTAHSHAADWPMWRYDAARSASSEQQLPDELHLQWMRALPKLEVAWPASSGR